MKFSSAVELLLSEGLVSFTKKVRRKLQRAYRKASSKRAVRSDYGVLMRPNWGDATFEYCVFGDYGSTLSALLRGKAEPFVFLDIGANQGLYALIAGQNSHCQAALAFEPVSRTFGLLCDNIRLNDLSGTVTPYNYGISTAEAEIPIFQSRDHSGKASLHKRPGNDDIEEIISIRTAAAIEGLLPPDLPLVVKIDVEGHEASVLQSLSTTAFAGRVTEVFYEVDEDWLDPASLEGLMRGMGFKTFVKHGAGRHYDILASR